MTKTKQEIERIAELCAASVIQVISDYMHEDVEKLPYQVARKAFAIRKAIIGPLTSECGADIKQSIIKNPDTAGRGQ